VTFQKVFTVHNFGAQGRVLFSFNSDHHLLRWRERVLLLESSSLPCGCRSFLPPNQQRQSTEGSVCRASAEISNLNFRGRGNENGSSSVTTGGMAMNYTSNEMYLDAFLTNVL